MKNIIQWAREFAGLDIETAYDKLKIDKNTLLKWESGKIKPQFKDIKNLSKKYNVPIGYFFLETPPVVKTNLVEYRTNESIPVENLSVNLTEMIFFAQDIQKWYKNYLIREGLEKNRIKIYYNHTNIDIKKVSQDIRELLDIERIREKSSISNFLNHLITQLEQENFLIIKSSIVKNSTSRKISTEECKGFCLYDEYAPLIFINASDFLKSQVFTLVHELAHILLNHNSLDKDIQNNTESLCNQIASEVLLPTEEFKQMFHLGTSFPIMEKKFKVSSFVLLIKLKQLKLISNEDFRNKWNNRLKKIKTSPEKKSGGDFYKNAPFKCGGKPFLRSVINSTIEGKTSYKECFQLTNISIENFDKAYNIFIKGNK